MRAFQSPEKVVGGIPDPGVTEVALRAYRTPSGVHRVECILRLRAGAAVVDSREAESRALRIDEVLQVLDSARDALVAHLSSTIGLQLSLD